MNKMSSKKVVFLFIAMLLLIGIIGCGGSNEPQAQTTPPKTTASNNEPADPMAAVIEAAQKEGKVVFYAGTGLRDVLDQAIPLFKEKYPGIEIELVEGTGAQNNERILTEIRANRPVADIVSSGTTTTFEFIKQGGTQAFDPNILTNIKDIDPRFEKTSLDPNHHAVGFYLNPLGITVNTNEIAEQDYPKSYKDLLDPKFKGKIVLHDPRKAGGGNSLLSVGYEPLGHEFYEQLAKQDVMLVGTPRQVDDTVSRGERAIGLPTLARILSLEKDSPVRWIVPEEGYFTTAILTSLTAKAPHPNAAQLWMNFTLSEEFQALLPATYRLPINKNVEIPESLRLSNQGLLGNGGVILSEGGNSHEWFKRAKEIFGE